MKSPVTGNEMTLTKEKRSMEFRRETFDIMFHYFQCAESGEQFTSTALDEVNMNQVCNKYREKFNIPFPEEIKRIREKYGLPAAKMSEILGFGINSYRQYETGDVPAAANAKLIQMAEAPENFIDMIDTCVSLSDDLKKKYIRKAKSLIEDRKQNIFQSNYMEYIMGGHMADLYSGYRTPNLEKYTDMVVYFAHRLQPFKTKMNKLLFYADFLSFRNTCFSISGIKYRAIEMGPVPQNFQGLYEFLYNNDEIEISTTWFPQGYTGEKFMTRKERPFNPRLFSEPELKVLEDIATRFQSTSATDIVKHSHKEKAWLKNEKTRSLISYEYAFEMEPL